MFMQRKAFLAFIFISVCGAGYLGFKMREDRLSKIHELQVDFPTGDTLISEVDWWGREPFLNDSSPDRRLFIRWKSTGEKELIADEGWIRIEPVNECRLYREHSTILIETPDAVYWRPDGDKGNWRRWAPTTPKRDPLYAYLRDYAAKDPSSEFEEVPQERGNRLTIPAKFSYTYIGDSVEGTWCLPYEYSRVDFLKNTLMLKLQRKVAGLPEILVFSGPANSFGQWEFDPVRTEALNSSGS